MVSRVSAVYQSVVCLDKVCTTKLCLNATLTHSIQSFHHASPVIEYAHVIDPLCDETSEIQVKNNLVYIHTYLNNQVFGFFCI